MPKKIDGIKIGNEIAESNGGKLLSNEYINNKTKMEWRCKEGHIWQSTLSSIKNGNRWCPQCELNSRADKYRNPLGLEEAREIANSYGGKCLSTEYKNNYTKLHFKCSKDHEWLATFLHVKHSKSWCPNCSAYKSENECREIFERLTNKKFVKIRPKWLEKLELDGYNEELKLAFEYQGIQHYKHDHYFHKNEGDSPALKIRDARKLEICNNESITLIIIPYTIKNLEEHIKKILIELNIILL